ncbi:unnamed protein product [Brassica oleracea var. botrytis]|uniref:(rape) hypothetical protein n=3 Tax=Brassica TaxID=3705 RepID=A0A816R6D9_BRANA|nr:unnamed protein product [Brassica napus]
MFTFCRLETLGCQTLNRAKEHGSVDALKFSVMNLQMRIRRVICSALELLELSGSWIASIIQDCWQT